MLLQTPASLGCDFISFVARSLEEGSHIPDKRLGRLGAGFLIVYATWPEHRIFAVRRVGEGNGRISPEAAHRDRIQLGILGCSNRTSPNECKSSREKSGI
jgi:hypothetical protein